MKPATRAHEAEIERAKQAQCWNCKGQKILPPTPPSKNPRECGICRGKGVLPIYEVGEAVQILFDSGWVEGRVERVNNHLVAVRTSSGNEMIFPSNSPMLRLWIRPADQKEKG